MRRLILTTLTLICLPASAQVDTSAKVIYRQSEQSVFLIYTNDSTGSPNALGSGFLVSPRTIVTNAHVIAEGNPVLAVGPVRIPLKILRTDDQNDLAVLSVDADLTSKPLGLSKEPVSPGEQIYAIGNPEGLEKTISQGIVSGLRVRQGRDLLQITSPISHGSSGGPILNVKGEVIGVAVGMLEDGQNLNFAVPVEKLEALLTRSQPIAALPTDVAANIAKATAVLDRRAKEDYSSDTASPYQRDTAELNLLVAPLLGASTKPGDLKQLVCLGTRDIDLSETGLKAAKKLAGLDPSSDSRAMLVYSLFNKASWEFVKYLVAKDGSEEESQALEAQKQFKGEAAKQALSIPKSKADAYLLAEFILADAKKDSKDISESIALFSSVAEAHVQVCGDELRSDSYLQLISLYDSEKKPDAAERWFRRYAVDYQVSAYQWDEEGDRRAKALDYLNAADAYERAASSTDSLAYDSCFASEELWGMAGKEDAVLSDGRKCVEASLKQTKDTKEKFKSTLPIVYRDMASVLDGRGAYQQAKEYINESISLATDDPFSLSIEADIFYHLDQFSECIAAANSAVNASDGKYPFMQFRLGTCYFRAENWSRAATAFKLAADGDKTDAPSAYNLGLSLSRQGFDSDAKQWYREALNRKPDEATRTKILESLQ